MGTKSGAGNGEGLARVAAPEQNTRLMPEAKKHRQRWGESLPEQAAFVMRGDLLDPVVLGETAQEDHSIYGFFGMSVFAEVGGITWDEIAATKLRRAEWIVVFTARTLLASGLELWDTGRRRTRHRPRRCRPVHGLYSWV